MTAPTRAKHRISTKAPRAFPAKQRTAVTSPLPIRTMPANARAPKAGRPVRPPAVRATGNNRRPDRARGRAPACRPAPASQARSRPGACPPRHRRCATIMSLRHGPAAPTAASSLPRASICAPLRSGARAAPPRLPDIGAASHVIVTRGSSCDRSHSKRSRSPASYCRRLTWPCA